MEAKGTAIAATVEYVRSTHGEDGVRRFLDALPAESRRLLSGIIMPGAWFPVATALEAPTRVACDLFHGGDISAAWTIGRFSADTALKGIYKALLVFVSPTTVVERGPGILTNYYRPLKTAVRQLAPTEYALEMSGMDEPSAVVDRRIAGWTERALEMAGAQGLSVRIVRSAADGAPLTEIRFVWR
jgi:hypothetical protein